MASSKPYLQDNHGHISIATEFEERVWMHHQHSDNGSGQYAAAYHLIGKSNLGRLVSALNKLHQFIPALNLRYHFDEDNGLVKSAKDTADQTINIEAVESIEEAIAHLQHKQSNPIQLDSQPPIQFIIYICNEKEVVLGIVSHQILSGQLSWKEVFDVLSALYNHGLATELSEKQNKTNKAGYTPLAKLSDLSESAISWIKRNDSKISWIQTGLSEDSSSSLNAAVSRKFATSIEINALEKYADKNSNRTNLLSVVAALFSRYMLEVNKLESLNVFVPIDAERDMFEMNGALIETDLTHLTLTPSSSKIEDEIDKIKEHIGSAQSQSSEYYDYSDAATLVTWLVDPSKHLSFENIASRKLSIAPLEPRFELALGVGVDEQGALLLELFVGPSVSAHIGAYILETFVKYIGGEVIEQANVLELEAPTPQETEFEESANSLRVEDIILEEFRDALASESMTKHDDFFDLGGHSLIATRVIGRLLTKHGIEVQINDLFSYSTAEQLAQHAIVQQTESTDSTDELANTTSVEQLILAEFREALSVETMSLDDDFFDCGGHSLIATRVIGRLLKNHGIEIQINDLFSYSTARSLSEHANCHDKAVEPTCASIEAAELSKAPLSLTQTSLWYAKLQFDEMGLKSLFNLPFALRFLDEVDETIFGQAFRDVLLRHSGLRSQFYKGEESPFQQVVPVEDVDNYKWYWTSEESEFPTRDGLLKSEASHVFDLENELPLRIRFVRDEESGQQFLSLLFHHIVLDEWSVNLMMDELTHAYKQRMSGAAPKWKELPNPFNEFARKQRESGTNQVNLNYWKNILEGVPWAKPIFPEDHYLAGMPDETGVASGGWVEIKLEQDVIEGLYALAKSVNASLFNVVYASITSALHFLGAPKNLVVGTPASGRLDAEYFDTIGYFTSIVAHLVKFGEVGTVAELIEQVKNSINESMPHTDIPLGLVQQELDLEVPEGGGFMFEVFIQLHAKNKFNGALELPNGDRLDFQQVDPDKSESGLGLQFEVLEEVVNGEQVLRVMMSYMSKNYSPAQVKLLSDTTSALFAEFAKSARGDQLLEDIKGRVIDSETV
ncbi:putative Non-ribosomal peptide synthetase module [Vibrio nigripulchritudo SFn27]|uniref:Putative Non-ribosomal peptide synthetase module n=1 Tax=Vibrio nigripulchritudo TaxID=28173 RepID=U4K550_9VIBR|nr:condensation domain-containing protein [Vibrio nigripulchritudo]CCN80845.1 putative Non-ribosomal peptide synthetase module [Vibrio nigripulchritudo BLFn1]CCN88039.1 putative Non-ribosomal peptide synthetase module [Vibrio nigripulchritudo SFn27]CCN96893.1 putative Non-ribosomal peptide synthetase module [Vibrio nigripulchritudo ENn2]CCO43454.1 putative Non-ribosomal peptide synthetase module [Vibrio nigripulchritudo SFn135]CCO51641.1 putative Non-ribosomal peptide synthetase module [Vibrio